MIGDRKGQGMESLFLHPMHMGVLVSGTQEISNCERRGQHSGASPERPREDVAYCWGFFCSFFNSFGFLGGLPHSSQIGHTRSLFLMNAWP